MKILYVSQYFPPEMGAPAARVSELSNHWAGAGHDVTVLTGFPNHPNGVIPRDYRGRFWRLVAREKVNGVNVVRTWLLPFPNRKAYERVLNYTSFFVSSAMTGLFCARPDVVIGTSPQLLSALSGWWLARMKGVPFVFEVRDLWPESLASVEMAQQESVTYRALAKIAGFLYRRADRIVVVSPAFKDVLCEQWKVPAEKIVFIPNGVETDQFSPSAPNEWLRNKLGAERNFVVSYIGTIGMAHGLETLVQAAALLQKSAPHVLFLVIGEGAQKEQIVSLAQAQGVSNLRFIGQQPREKIPSYICASEVCLVLLRKSELFKTVIPSKMLEFMSCARPLIVGVEGEARRIMERADCGIFVEPENPAALASAVTRLAADSDFRDRLGTNGRLHVMEHYSRARTAQNYLEILHDLLKTESPLLDCDDADRSRGLQRRLERASG